MSCCNYGFSHDCNLALCRSVCSRCFRRSVHVPMLAAGLINCGRLRPRRHGDKGSEMTLVPFEQYVLAAEKLIAENPLGLKRIGFVSTEDPYVIEQAANMTRIFDGAFCCFARSLGGAQDQA